jgi:putative spermidine/putrescine transport system substrate-binding protein
MIGDATTRRALLGGMAGAAALGTGLGAGARGARAAAAPPPPAAPVTLNVIDVAGQLQLVQRALETFVSQNPKLVSKINFSQAPSPELPGKIKAQQSAGRVDIDLVLTGTDALSAGIDQKLWIPIAADYAEALPDLKSVYQPGAWAMQGLAQGQGVCTVFCPAGPLLEYMPDAVKKPPATTQELLDWTRQNPKRFLYARPANSGPGRSWLQGLPYLLGDKDPKDPANGWDKTWEYLAEIGKNVEYYPTGTAATMKELGEGTRDMIVTMTGWDINPRALGVVPKEAEVATLKGFHWVTDGQYFCVPKGVSDDKLAVLLAMTSYMLTKPAQATTYDKGYFYPGPAVAGVTLDVAPADSQAVIKEFGRPMYDELIANTPTETPLPADKLIYAFQRWDQQIGAKVGKK